MNSGDAVVRAIRCVQPFPMSFMSNIHEMADS